MNYYDPINIEISESDNRELIMPHQQEAVDELVKYFDLSGESKGKQTGLVVMPTGSGKTFTAVNWLLKYGIPNGYKIVWLAHRQELIDQTNKEFRNQAPILFHHGIKKLSVIPVSGLKEHFRMSNASKFDINICSMQSIANKYGYRFIKRMLGTTGAKKLIVVIDEAHHAINYSYQKVLKRITEINPNVILLGLTATPTRMLDSERKKLFEIFNVLDNKKQKIGSPSGYIYEVKLKHLIQHGFLARPVYKRQETNINGEVEYLFTYDDIIYFDKFRDFTEQMKEQIAKSSARNKVIVNHYLDNKVDYGKTLVFAVNQLHAKLLCEEFNASGVSCDYVVSDKPRAQDTIKDFKNNKFEVLINVQILTEGSDVPDIQTVFLTRETNSDSLLMQMIGRALRGKSVGGTEKAYVVDFHDKWESFSFWLDPHSLDIFTDTEINESDNLDEIEEETLDIEIQGDISMNQSPVNWGEVYSRLYKTLKANVLTKTTANVMPNGWYTVVDAEGLDDIVLVYDNQLDGYAELNKRFRFFIERRYPTKQIMSILFNSDMEMPRNSDFENIMDMIKDTGEMPNYFTFEERKNVDPEIIAQKIYELFGTESKNTDIIEDWLKNIYDKTPILKVLYKTFYMFKRTILMASKEKNEAVIKTIDEREEYEIIQDYFNLDDILAEVLDEFSFLQKDNLQSITWSSQVVRKWYGICYRWDDNIPPQSCDIQLNKLLSSPKVDREVIKYLIYHELLHSNGWWEHDAKFRELEWSYPESDKYDGFLDELALRYKLEIPSRVDQYELYTKRLKEDQDKQTELVQDEVGEDATSEKSDNLKVPIIDPDIKYCRNCGNKLPSSAKFCDKCGSMTDY